MGSQPLPERVTDIQSCPPPKSVSQLRRFLGMLYFYRRFLPHAATTQAPLHDALSGPKLKGSHPVTWDDTCCSLQRVQNKPITSHSTGLSPSNRSTRPSHRRFNHRHGCRPPTAGAGRLATPRLLIQEAEPGTAKIRQGAPGNL